MTTTGRQLATQLNKPFAAKLWALFRKSDRKMEDIATDVGCSTSQLYRYTENGAILPAYRVGALVRAAGSVRRELAELILDARASGLVVIEETAAAAPGDIRDQAMGLTVDVGVLIAAIRDASRPESDGGEKITLGELERIMDGIRELIRHSHELERGAARLKVV